jgi:hypothetical protein
MVMQQAVEAPRIRQRRERRDKGIRLCTPRDRWVLRWIAEQDAVRFDHVQQLLSRDPRPRNGVSVPGPAGVSASNVGQVIHRWERLPQWAEYQRIYTDEPGWITVAPSGLQMLSLPSTYHTLSEKTLEHMHAINCIRLDIERQHPDYRWTSERVLRATLPPKEGIPTKHLPDGQIWRAEGQVVAVEVALNPKDEEEIDHHLHELLFGDEDTQTYQTVWYYVSQATPANVQARRVVENARQRLPEEFHSRIQMMSLNN